MKHNQAIVFLAGLQCSLLAGILAVDNTLKNGTTGPDVVQAVIAKLDASKIAFHDDHRLLRRLAFVETADGTTSSSTKGGGLWNINQDKLDAVRTSSELEEMRIVLKTAFGIDWGSLTLQDVVQPFLAGIVAKLYLIYLETTRTADIPLAGDIQGQASFWLQYYHSNQGGVANTENYFIEKIDLLEEREGCKVNLDIFFVLDGSGSIGTGDFAQVRLFEYEFVKQLRIGPKNDQVGTIVFSNSATVSFNLNSFDSTTELLRHIVAVGYPAGSTNTADGLCKLVRYGFADGYGARPSSGAVFRIAIVMTDGKSNVNSTECGWDTLQAAKAVHQLKPPLLVYAIGVTDDVDDEELNAIATGPDFVMRLASFNQCIIQEAQESHVDEVCRRATLPADTSEEMNGTLDANETVCYHFQVPVAGITVQVCISVGHITVYGSYSVPNPNSALYDFILDFESDEKESDKCKSSYIDPNKIHTQPTITSTAPQPTVVPNVEATDISLTDKIVYISIIGIGEENNFMVNASVGNTIPDHASIPNLPSGKVVLIVLAVGSAVFLVTVVLLTILCSMCCCCFICRRKTSVPLDQYKLVSKKTDEDYCNDVV